MANPSTHTGSCLCGAVTYAVAVELEPIVICHCTMCRRQTGHFLATTNAAAADLALSGAEHVRWYQSSEQAERGFCGTCGSVLFWRRRNGSDRVAIAMGGFDLPTGATIGRHIFVAEKGDYYEVEADAPQFEGDD
ncbi:GFA family protein [Kaistia dalseonensis]|uniref:CENP-V/GFA domain-containing protein n=1 Tax=Kaistia dalseonensis TaxID=410840 RepID=A0ABU0H3D7_9HYPH|nr:GFA family protein [Kaistia dalseonensis]MCX5494230.1 GFA family protein [Kaistia dalseonensis]MDQ0436809.1 hypothetical protein [Kaistia dalseonensis]